MISPISDSSGAVSLPISLLDPNTSIIGLWIDPTNQQLPKAIAGSIPTDKKGQVDYSNASAHIRTAYKGLDQWARQISPSAESYIPYVDVSGYTNVPGYRGVYSSTGNNPITTSYASPAAGMNLLPREPWREYFWTSGSSNIIYFHASEAGKSVQVSFVSTSGKTINNQLLTIDKAITEANLLADFVPVRDVNNTNLGYVSSLFYQRTPTVFSVLKPGYHCSYRMAEW